MNDAEQRNFPEITFIMSLFKIRSLNLKTLPPPEYQAIDAILNTGLGQGRHARLVDFVISCELVSTLLDLRRGRNRKD